MLKELGIPLIWLSVYEGFGDVARFTSAEQAEFWDSGARFLPVHRMVEDVGYLTKVCVCVFAFAFVYVCVCPLPLVPPPVSAPNRPSCLLL